MPRELLLPRFLDLLEEENKKLNLISYETRQELEVKHLQDSLSLLEVFELEEGQRVLDIGAGGGFPSIPLAIMAPQTEFVLMDSTAKKMATVQSIADELGLNNVKTVAGRFEELGHDDKYREAFGMVLARAVAPLPTLLEYAAPFICVNGLFVAYKSADYDKELDDSANAMKELNLSYDGAIDYELAEGMGSRSLLIFVKEGALSEKYPRRVGVAKKRPL